MDLEIDSGSHFQGRSSGDPAKEQAFWDRYRSVVLESGVEPGLDDWYRRHVERFIKFLKPRRLREGQPAIGNRDRQVIALVPDSRMCGCQ